MNPNITTSPEGHIRESVRTKLAIIDSVASADRFLREQGHGFDGFRIVSLHPLVQEYVAKNQIDCRDISTYIDDAAFERNLKKAERCTRAALAALDQAYAARLSQCLGIDLRLEWFDSLYRHIGRYELAGVLNGLYAIEAMLASTRPEQIVCFGTSSFSSLKPEGNLKELFEAVFQLRPGLAVPISYRTFDETAAPAKRTLKQMAVAAIRSFYELRNFLAVMRRQPLTVLLENLYDLKFLRQAYRPFSSLVWGYDGDPWVIGRLDAPARAQMANLATTVAGLDFSAHWSAEATHEAAATNIVLGRIENDFRRNIDNFGAVLLKARNLMTNARIDKLVWGCDPNVGFKALLVEYFLKAGITVIGSLHGNGYGTHAGNEQNQSAHSRCTKFLSYGYTRTDVEQTSTDSHTMNTEIVPVGSYRIRQAAMASNRRPARNRQRIDLFYPITNNYSLFLSSQRSKVDTFVSLQKALLRTLNDQTDRNIVVKLPPVSVDAPSALGWQVERSINLRTTSQNILRLIRQHDVRAVLIDASFSTCLLEVIPFDCEVFVMHDPLVPLSAPALELLQKRVHYLYTAEEFDAAFRGYLADTLERRRDARFMEKYIYAGTADIKTKILKTINAS